MAIFYAGLSINAQAQKINVKKQFALAEKRYSLMLKTHPDTDKTPQSVNQDG